MKKLFLFLVIASSGCDDYGDIIHVHGTKLISIHHDDEGEEWEENFLYDSLGRLVEIRDNKKIVGRIYQIEYDGSRILQYRTFDAKDGREVSRDSVTYNETGQIEKHITMDHTSGLPSFAYEFAYDSTGNVYSSKLFSYETMEYFWSYRYYWENGNIIREEQFNEDGELYYEFFIEYDGRNNYRSILTYLMYSPVTWGRNNVTRSSFHDYHGDLDVICNPCNTKYDYNLDGFPVKVLQFGKHKMVLYYE